MSKRDTTGGPKQRRLTQEDIQRRQEYKSKAQREHEVQRIVLIVTVVLVTLVVIIVAGALIYDNAVLPRESLVTVNGEEININQFKGRVQYERFKLAEQMRSLYDELVARGLEKETAQQQVLGAFSSQQEGQPGLLDYLIVDNLLGEQVLQQLEREKVIEQKAEEFGIEVDDSQFDDEVNNLVALYTGRSLTVTPSATPSEEPSITPSPFVSATPSATPTITPIPSDTPIPTVEGCTTEPCATVTILPTSTIVDPLFAVTFTPTPSATFTPLAQEQVVSTVESFRKDFFEQGDEESKLDEEAIRDTFYAAALQTALRDFVTSAEFLPGEEDENGEPLENVYYVPLQDTYVKIRHILIQFPEGEVVSETDTENVYFQEAQQVLEALNAGEDFAALALIHSDDPGSNTNGGFYDWAPSSNYVEGFREATEDTPLGQFTEPVYSQFGYHIIQVLDRELRDVPESTLEQRRNEQFALWLDGETTLARVERREDWSEFIPTDPTYNDLLDDILPRYNEDTGGFSDDEE